MVSQASAEIELGLRHAAQDDEPPDRHHHRPAHALHDARAATKSGSDLREAAQPIEPSVKTTIAARNTVRAPKRSATQPLKGMNTASDSR